MVSSQGISVYVKQHKGRPTPRERYSFEDTHDEACDTADFSGISILAAAACNSDIVGDIINAGGFNPKDQSSKRKVLSNIESSEPVASCEEKVQYMLISEDLGRECSLPAEMSSSTLSVKVFDVNGLPSSKSSVGLRQDVSDTFKASSCNPRLHWDLNTVMYAWKDDCGDILNCQPITTDHRVESSQSERHSILHTCNNKVHTAFVSAFEDGIVNVVGSQMDDCVSLEAEIGKEHGMSNVKSSDAGEANQCSISCVYGNDEMEHHLDVDSVSFMGSNENICSAENISHADEAFTKYSSGVEFIEKPKSDEVSKSVEFEPTSILIFGEHLSCHFTHKPYCNLGESTKDTDSNENADDNERTGKSNVKSNPEDHCLIYSQIPHFNSNPRIERNLDMNSSDNTNDYPSTNHLDGIASMEPIYGNVYGDQKGTYGISGEVVPSDKSIIEASREPCQTNTHCCDMIESSDNGIIHSQTAHDEGHEMCTVDQNAVDSICATFSDVNFVFIRRDYNDYDSLKASIPMSPGTRPLKVDADMADDVSGIKVESECYLANCVNSCKGDDLNDNLGLTSETNSGNEYANQANAMEKIHFLKDDNSRYEDGEVWESVLHSWEVAADEVDTKHPDCVSDNKEIVFEPPSVPPICLPADGIACKNMDFTACNGAHSGKDMDLTISQPLLKCSSITDHSNAEYGMNGAGTACMDYSGLNGGRKSQKFVEYASLSTGNIAGYISNDHNREASASTRMKMSGWNQMPESRRHSRENVSDKGTSSKKYHSEGSFDAVANGKSFKSSSSFKRDLSSQIERPSSSDEPRGSHVKDSRSHESNDVDVKAEVDVGALNLSGLYKPSHHAQGKERGAEQWLDHTPSFSQSGYSNAAAAAVAKVESNGFVVAPDGTLIKAGNVGPSGRLPKRSANSLHASDHSLSGRGSSFERNHTCNMWKRRPRSRETSPYKYFTDDHDRVGRYNNEIIRSRYHRPEPGNHIQLDFLHISRRDRSFSPRRGKSKLTPSPSRSPFRLRTNSTCNWTPPKERRKLQMNDGPLLCRRSRSPLLSSSDARIKSMRSPQQRPNYVYHTVASRNHASQPHAPQDSRKGSPDHFKELDYRQNSGSTATMRMVRNERFNSMNAQGGLKSGDYRRPLPSRRVSNFAADFSRGSGQDTIPDRRGHVDRYEPPQWMSKHGQNSKRAHYDLKEFPE